MKNFMNEGFYDRTIRLSISLAVFILAYFWLPSTLAFFAYLVVAIGFLTAAFGTCPLYFVFKINTKDNGGKLSKKSIMLIAMTLLLFAILGSYASDFFSRKIFLEDYNSMNSYYKQALFNTGKEKRPESVENYNMLVTGYKEFSLKYQNYRPYFLKGDNEFKQDLIKIENLISLTKDKVITGNLKDAHLDLEKVRPIFQDILKRNGFSMLAVVLVDFHDSMEKVIEASDAKNPTGVISTYEEASLKLKEVEILANDDEIKTIRKNLDDILNLAKENKSDELSKKAAELKSSFVKVYLIRG